MTFWDRLYRPMPGHREAREPSTPRTNTRKPRTDKRARNLAAEVRETLKYERDLGTDSERADLCGEVIGGRANTTKYRPRANDPGEMK